MKRQNFLQKRLGTDSIGFYTPVQIEITEKTDLDQILELHGGAANQRFLICGLHTCGNLATSSIRLFTKSSEAKTLCIVGCCYNLIKEEFDSEDQSNSTSNQI